MHAILQWLLSQEGHIVAAVRLAIRALRAIGAAIKHQLRTSSEDLATNAPTASVIRGSRTRLRWWQWPAARALQREGHGRINNGEYHRWEDVTPTGVLMAIQRRAMFSTPRRYNDWY